MRYDVLCRRKTTYLLLGAVYSDTQRRRRRRRRSYIKFRGCSITPSYIYSRIKIVYTPNHSV